MNAGDTFILANRDVDEHLWFVLSDPAEDPANVVIASFTSWRQDKEQACIVEPDEHSFVVRKTCVSYGDAKIVTDAFLNEKLAAGHIEARDPLGEVLLDKIRSRAADSRRMKTAAWQILERQQDDMAF